MVSIISKWYESKKGWKFLWMKRNLKDISMCGPCLVCNKPTLKRQFDTVKDI